MEIVQNTDREVVAVVHPIVPGNELGYALKYRDEMTADDVLYVEPGSEPVEEQEAAKPKRKAKGEAA